MHDGGRSSDKLETPQGDLESRRLMFLCLLPAGAVRSQMYVKINFTTFRQQVILQVLKLFTICEQNTKVWTVIYSHAKFGLLCIFIHVQSLTRQLQLLSKCSIK